MSTLFRNSGPEVLYKIGALKNYIKTPYMLTASNFLQLKTDSC